VTLLLSGRHPFPPSPPWRFATPPQSRLPGVHTGYCGIALTVGNCTVGDSGVFLGPDSLPSCVDACTRCARCALVSWSRTQDHGRGDCSWYAACDLGDLRRPPAQALDYVTKRVKAEPAPLPSALLPSSSDPPPRPIAPGGRAVTPRRAATDGTQASHVSVAVATLATSAWTRKKHRAKRRRVAGDGAAPSSALCALVQWCEGAALFARALRSNGLGWTVRVVVIGESRSVLADCPDAIFHPLDANVSRAMRTCGAGDAEAHPVATDINMYKWGLLRLHEYDFVVFADADINLMSTNDLQTTSARWADVVTRALASGASSNRHPPWPTFVANADAMSPVNAGLWIVRPSVALYRDGLQVMSRCKWNTSHGWELVGPPQSLGLTLRHPDGRPLDDVADHPHKTDAYLRDSWDFVSGARNQGFFWYFFYIRHRVGAYFRYQANAHRVLHWRAWPKPWSVGDAFGFAPKRALLAKGGVVTTAEVAPEDIEEAPPWLLGRAYAYLLQSSMLGGGSSSASSCVRSLWSFRRAIEDSSHFHDLPEERLGSSVPFFPMW
jgi:hypothetical protein